jgi:hypothetical protein
MQTSAMKVHFLIAECSLSYAKVGIFLMSDEENTKKVRREAFPYTTLPLFIVNHPSSSP